eukprot:257782-Prymnesium_polylepis.2
MHVDSHDRGSALRRPVRHRSPALRRLASFGPSRSTRKPALAPWTAPGARPAKSAAFIDVLYTG